VVVAYIRRTSYVTKYFFTAINPLNAELNPISHLLALLGAHHILHVSKIRVKGGKPHFSDSSGYCTCIIFCAAGRVL